MILYLSKGEEGIPYLEDSCFKVRLEAKGFSQIRRMDYTNIFFPMVKHTYIIATMVIVAHHDYKLEKLNLKIFS